MSASGVRIFELKDVQLLNYFYILSLMFLPKNKSAVRLLESCHLQSANINFINCLFLFAQRILAYNARFIPK